MLPQHDESQAKGSHLEAKQDEVQNAGDSGLDWWYEAPGPEAF